MSTCDVGISGWTCPDSNPKLFWGAVKPYCEGTVPYVSPGVFPIQGNCDHAIPSTDGDDLNEDCEPVILAEVTDVSPTFGDDMEREDAYCDVE